VAARAVLTTADEHHDDDQQHQGDGDDPEYFYPAWCAGVAVGVGVVGRISDVRVLLCRAC
jgi:hypothetical protein